MPDGGPRYVARSSSIQWSFVNGQPIIRNGVLPSPKPSPALDASFAQRERSRRTILIRSGRFLTRRM